VAALYQGVGRPVPKEFQGPPPDQDTVNRWQQTSMSVKDQIAARKKNLETKEVVGPDGKTVTLQTFDKETGQLRPMTDPSGQPVIAPKTLDVADKAADNARQAATETEREHHDRAMEAHARAMEARLAQAAVANNLNPQDIKTSVRTTLSGKQYLDMTDFESAKERSAARQAAAAAGIPAVDKATGASLRAIDTAKQNAQSMWDAVKDKLPKDASGRILAGPGNKLSAYFQTEPQLAAFNAFRTAAIQQVQALAEPGMGLRINQAEITAAMENDIPQITDDLATAATRLKNLTTMLNHKENDALTRDRSTLMPGAAPAPTAGKNPFRK
jgi:hypothetical protein